MAISLLFVRVSKNTKDLYSHPLKSAGIGIVSVSSLLGTLAVFPAAMCSHSVFDCLIPMTLLAFVSFLLFTAVSHKAVDVMYSVFKCFDDFLTTIVTAYSLTWLT